MQTSKAVQKLVSLSLTLFPLVCDAKVTGPCGNCHTMHNSQGGIAVVRNLVNGSMELSDTPHEALLNTSCIGCHQGNNSADGLVTPYVLQTSAPAYSSTGTEGDTTTLAGGNFFWVSSGQEATGHNVSGFTAVDSRFGNVPPGGVGLDVQLQCAGTNGCHGDRSVGGEIESMLKSHHTNDMSSWKDGTTLAASYRFLYSVQGLEDTEYEYRPDSSHHNKYYGIDRTLETQNVNGTISNLCAQCHGDFHQGAGNIASGSFGSSGVWLRHPTDFDMGRASSSGEYEKYNGGTGAGNTYSVISPVATSDKTASVNSTVYSTTDDAVVMCLSCHRAHGTPYGAMLRWDYKLWPGGGYNGCAVCHTTKD
ncbi:MAG: cytochrome c3 family protein [Deltaproteobacteria bacterium]|nr:cytochrome c3 family protein [Deltaproteobacteria bacterium]